MSPNSSKTTSNTFTRSVMRALAFASLLLASATVFAQEIILVNNDGSNEGFNDSSAPFVGQTGNSGSTLGEQRLNVFRAAADYWQARLNINVPVRIGINFDRLNCSAFSATLGSAGPTNVFRDFPNAPLSSTWYVSAVADSLAGSDLGGGGVDIVATFNSDIDNNPNCLRNTNWWLGIDSPAVGGSVSLFDTVLHEIGHGLGVLSLVSQRGEQLAGLNDAYSANLFDVTANRFWGSMSNTQRATSAINTGNLVWRGSFANANSNHLVSGKTNGFIRMYAPNPYEGGSSVSHWDTALSPDELMEPSATPTSDDRSTLQLLRDVGWSLKPDPTSPGTIGFTSNTLSVFEDQGIATLRIERTNGQGGAVSVNINSADISAQGNGIDYDSVTNQSVSWANGETGIKTIQVTVVNDNLVENGGETALFSLSSPTNGAALGQASLTLNILDPFTNDDDEDSLLQLISGIIAGAVQNRRKNKE